nr:hypothetical protein [Desulforamulus aquiferis]
MACTKACPTGAIETKIPINWDIIQPS